MERVVLTGAGIVSSLGANKDEVLSSLKAGKSGISFNEEQEKLGFRSHVAGLLPKFDFEALIDKKALRFMSDGAKYATIAMYEAIEQSGLTADQISDPRVGLIVGSGGGSYVDVVESCEILHAKGVKRVGPYRVPRVMTSGVSACLATLFKVQGINYGISSACSTSAHCIGAAMEQIQLGKQDVVFAGGGESLEWQMTLCFDAMGALSSKFNDNPTKASRAFDTKRDGFVISGGGGIVVLESLSYALQRGANIIAEITGYSATSDGYNMVAPSGVGARACMTQAKQMSNGPIDYINTHGTSTPVGDVAELEAIQDVFSDKLPYINSTKSLSGHSLGAAGVHEAIYSLLMMQNNFVCASANIEELDDVGSDMPILKEMISTDINRVMSNSFGFGGTNASLVFETFQN